MLISARKSASALNELTATEIVAAIAAGRTTCEAVARACLERIAAREPQVRAWAHLDPDRVIAQARALDRAPPRGPLHGVPFGVKDIIDTCDLPTEYGTPIHRGHRPAARRGLRRALAQGRWRADGQNRHHRIRQHHAGADAQPARSLAHAGRFLERLRRPRWPTSWCRSRSARRPRDRRPARLRSAACSATAPPTETCARPVSWRLRGRSTRSAYWRARSRT